MDNLNRNSLQGAMPLVLVTTAGVDFVLLHILPRKQAWRFFAFLPHEGCVVTAASASIIISHARSCVRRLRPAGGLLAPLLAVVAGSATTRAFSLHPPARLGSFRLGSSADQSFSRREVVGVGLALGPSFLSPSSTFAAQSKKFESVLRMSGGSGGAVPVSVTAAFDAGNIECVNADDCTSALGIQVKIKDDPFTELEKKNHKQVSQPCACLYS